MFMQIRPPTDLKSNWPLSQRQARVTTHEYDTEAVAESKLKYSSGHLPQALQGLGIGQMMIISISSCH